MTDMNRRATANVRKFGGRTPRERLLRPSRLPGFDLLQSVAGDYQYPGRDWSTIDVSERRAAARRLITVATVGIVVTNVIVGIETVFLVALVTTGGDLVAQPGTGGQNIAAIIAALLVGVVVDLIAGLFLLMPQIRWFVSGNPADTDRRRSVQKLPMLGVLATAFGWAAGVLVYIAIGYDVGLIKLIVVFSAFTLAGASSGCVTYMILERAGRPLVAAAMRDAPPRRPMLGVRERMIVLWIVCSGVPLIGMLMMNVGRAIGWLPTSSTALDVPTVVLASVCLLSGARAIALISKSITDPLRGMRRAVEKLGVGEYGAKVDVYDSSELGILQHGFNEMVDGLGERERMRDLFARHVGSEVADQAMRRESGMYGVNTDVGVLFVDIEGSTRFAESTDPETVAKMLNRFFTIVAEVVARHGGFINKFEGDAALAVFGAPTPLDDPAGAALRAARELGPELEALHPLRCGIGTSAGPVFAGNIGAETRYEYTVIGDPVNECARLAEIAKTARSNVLASGAAIAASSIGDEVDDREQSAWGHDTDLDDTDLQYSESGDLESGADESAEVWNWVSLGSVALRGRAAHTELFAPAEDDEKVDTSSLSDIVDGLIRLPLAMLKGR
ncbi:MAG: adenylate/guanylate cyclase domain-containing protein, partial [Williamsia sp.]|nr:adenylate/guanylate cyclase domain-containing protein [Williamsia sp.]